MDLFDIANKQNEKANIPLAERMRAKTLSEFVGQEHIAKDTSLLRRAIKLDRLGSCIFYGPPGCGKTTLANIIANSTNNYFVKLNAVSSGVSDVKQVVEKAKENLKLYGKKTYLMLDECHRFNKTQSDSLLPAIEQGDIIFIGSTTENPYASMTPAIVSRCRVFELKKLSQSDIKRALEKALIDKEKGLGSYDLSVDVDAIDHIAKMADGDLRVAYNALELACLTTNPDSNGKIKVTLTDAEESIQQKAMSYDESLYYDILSAFCKSLRGSDSDAALYYMQRLIQGGCDPLLLARRLIVHSAEDVGMADPNALVVATNAMLAFERLGLPEGLIPLSEAVIYVCEAEKSNSVVLAMQGAKEDAINEKDDNIPAHLKNYEFASKEDKQNKVLYKYPHNYGGYVEQQYLPDELLGKTYYSPTNNGYEKKVIETRKNKGKKV